MLPCLLSLAIVAIAGQLACNQVLSPQLPSLCVLAPTCRPSSASTQRTGCKPATHSTRSLVPLLDARAAGRARSQAAASQAPAFR